MTPSAERNDEKKDALIDPPLPRSKRISPSILLNPLKLRRSAMFLGIKFKSKPVDPAQSLEAEEVGNVSGDEGGALGNRTDHSGDELDFKHGPGDEVDEKSTNLTEVLDIVVEEQQSEVIVEIEGEKEKSIKKEPI